MLHQYKLNGYDIVLDTCSGSVHSVDDLAYDIIAMYPTAADDEIVSAMLEKYGDDPTVDENEIRDLLRGDFAAVGNAKRAELVVARRLDRLVERPAGDADEAAEAVGEERDGTCDVRDNGLGVIRNVGKRCSTLLDLHAQSAERIQSVRLSRRAHRIGNDHHAVRPLRLRDELYHRIGEMHAVGDYLVKHVVREKASRHHRRTKVVYRHHRVAEVGEVRHPRSARALECAVVGG